LHLVERFTRTGLQTLQYEVTIEDPKTIEDLIERSNRFTVPRADGARPNPGRWAVFKREASSGSLDDYRYTSVRDYGLPLVRSTVEGLFAAERIDAIVYPTATRRPALLAAPPDTAPPSPTASATNIANLTGFPDLIVPAGFTGDDLPVGVSFLGPPSASKSFCPSVTALSTPHAHAAGRCTRPRSRGNRF
jgi:Asp-tRNA(Asn)/Glu-tRNA(Gln) amidotransferase A subunit family amidase